MNNIKIAKRALVFKVDSIMKILFKGECRKALKVSTDIVLIFPNNTRWNSICLLVEHCPQLEGILYEIVQENINLATNLCPVLLTSEDTNCLKDIYDMLLACHSVSVKLQRSLGNTLSDVYTMINYLIENYS